MESAGIIRTVVASYELYEWQVYPEIAEDYYFLQDEKSSLKFALKSA